MIIRVSVVLRRTVRGDFDRRFDNPSGSELWNVSRWYMSLVVSLIGQRSRDCIGRLSVSRDVIGSGDCKKNEKE